MNNHRHLSILYTNLQEDLRSSEQGRGHGKRGCTERDSFKLRLMYQSVMHHVFLILLNRRLNESHQQRDRSLNLSSDEGVIFCQ
jgi:hypothetical protein